MSELFDNTILEICNLKNLCASKLYYPNALPAKMTYIKLVGVYRELAY